jgi:hypothetical protein
MNPRPAQNTFLVDWDRGGWAMWKKVALGVAVAAFVAVVVMAMREGGRYRVGAEVYLKGDGKEVQVFTDLITSRPFPAGTRARVLRDDEYEGLGKNRHVHILILDPPHEGLTGMVYPPDIEGR